MGENESKAEAQNTETSNAEQEQVVKAESEKATFEVTEESINKLINQRFEELNKQKAEQIDEAKKLAQMNEQEKTAYEYDKLKKELAEYKSREQLALMTKTARNMLSEANISVPDELISLMVTSDAEKTKSAVNSFATLFNEAVEKAVKMRLKGNSPKSKGNSGGSMLTIEKIMSIKDPIERQQAIIDNKALFNI